MNDIQRRYCKVKANRDAFLGAVRKLEQAYIAEHDLRNEDGTVPEALLYWHDDRSLDVYCQLLKDSGMDKRMDAVEAELLDAEKGMLDWGIPFLKGRELQWAKQAREPWRISDRTWAMERLMRI